MKFEEIYKKVLDADKKFKEQGIPINLDFKIEDLRDALIESMVEIKRLKAEIDEWAQSAARRPHTICMLRENLCILDSELRDTRRENAYLRMLAAKAISRVYRMRYSLAWINHPFEKGRKKERYDKWIDKFTLIFRKAKAEFENLKGR
jgi:hypothetical protein